MDKKLHLLGIFRDFLYPNSLMEGEKNSIKRCNNMNNYVCTGCDYITNKKFAFQRHIITQKHISNNSNNNHVKTIKTLVPVPVPVPVSVMKERNPSPDRLNKVSNIKEQIFSCECCNYNTVNKKDYHRHLITRKHLQKDGTIEQKEMNTTMNEPTVTTLIMELMKRQDFLQTTIIELAKNQTIANSTITNNSNNNNQQFNLQFFLNETCKDAMNIEDFINSLKIGIEDFETTGKLGYVEGITQIILNGLKQVDTTKRPIHCTDAKRETVYIKNENTWEKENMEKERLKNAVSRVARMNLSQLPKWQKENPASEFLDTVENDNYIKYSLSALGGKNDKEEECYVGKIMKNIMKETIVDKTQFT
jgi:hypothetical protein